MHSCKLVLVAMLMMIITGCSPVLKKPKLVVINILDKPMYDDCHIKGSINVPFDILESALSSLNKHDEIIVYCSNYQCTASKYAAQLLKKHGFNNVMAYEAGMAEWYQQGLPVEGHCKQAYLNQVIEAENQQDNEIAVVSTEALKHKIKHALAVNIAS